MLKILLLLFTILNLHISCENIENETSKLNTQIQIISPANDASFEANTNIVFRVEPENTELQKLEVYLDDQKIEINQGDVLPQISVGEHELKLMFEGNTVDEIVFTISREIPAVDSPDIEVTKPDPNKDSSGECPDIEAAKAIQLEAERQIDNLITETNSCENHRDCVVIDYSDWIYYPRICRRDNPFGFGPNPFGSVGPRSCYQPAINVAKMGEFVERFSGIENECLTKLNNCGESELENFLPDFGIPCPLDVPFSLCCDSRCSRGYSCDQGQWRCHDCQNSQ